MNAEEIFAVWAPGRSRSAGGQAADWSQWAKPVLFAAIGQTEAAAPEPAEMAPPVEVAWAEAALDTAVVVDLAGAEAVWTGLALARRGYRPVPLFNGCPGPSLWSGGTPSTGGSAVINLHELVHAMVSATPRLAAIQVPPAARPAFLLDARRLRGAGTAQPGQFDNRWAVLPQDFPSSNLLAANGIRRAVLVQQRPGQPQDDLVHVLRRWQRAGIAIEQLSPGQTGGPQPLRVRRPLGFGALCHAALVVMGLRRNAAGGFGGLIPIPPSGGGSGGWG